LKGGIEKKENESGHQKSGATGKLRKIDKTGPLDLQTGGVSSEVGGENSAMMGSSLWAAGVCIKIYIPERGGTDIDSRLYPVKKERMLAKVEIEGGV